MSEEWATYSGGADPRVGLRIQDRDGELLAWAKEQLQDAPLIVRGKRADWVAVSRLMLRNALLQMYVAGVLWAREHPKHPFTMEEQIEVVTLIDTVILKELGL